MGILLTRVLMLRLLPLDPSAPPKLVAHRQISPLSATITSSDCRRSALVRRPLVATTLNCLRSGRGAYKNPRRWDEKTGFSVAQLEETNLSAATVVGTVIAMMDIELINVNFSRPAIMSGQVDADWSIS